MAPAATAAARAARAAPARSPAPRPATRRAAPRPRASGAAAPASRARMVPLAVGRTASAVSNLADTGLLFRLTRGRLWIGTLTALLVGIVALNVMQLSFGAAASTLGRQSDIVNRENSALRTRLAATLSDERVQQAAGRDGLIQPAPGEIRYRTYSGGEAAIAAKRLAAGDLTYGAATAAAATSLVPPPPTAAPAATTVTTAPTTTAPATTTAPPTAAVAPPAAAPATTPSPPAATAAGGVSAP